MAGFSAGVAGAGSLSDVETDELSLFNTFLIAFMRFMLSCCACFAFTFSSPNMTI